MSKKKKITMHIKASKKKKITMRVKASKRKKITCLTFYAFYAFMIFMLAKLLLIISFTILLMDASLRWKGTLQLFSVTNINVNYFRL